MLQSPAGNIVSIGIDSLTFGRSLNHPIHDTTGVLLLAAGSTITPEIQLRLKARGVRTLQVHQDDAGIAMTSDDSAVNGNESQFDSEIAKPFGGADGLGRLSVRNSGAAVSGKLVSHGQQSYDPQRQANLLEQNERTSGHISEMMSRSLETGQASGDEVTTIATQYLSHLTEDIDNVLTSATETLDHGLAEHCLQMALMGMAIGVELGLDEDNVRTIGTAGLIHDWAMKRVPLQTRNCERILTPVEFLDIQKHPAYSIELLQDISGLPDVVPLIAYQIHERPNGMGYPRGRTGNSIHLFARILHVADAYVSLTSWRPYRPPLMAYAAIECLLKQAHSNAVDPLTVRALVRIVSLFPIGSYVALSDGSVAKVMRRNGDQFASPMVQIIQDDEGNSITPEDDDILLNLADSELEVTQALPTPGRIEIGTGHEIIDRKYGLNGIAQRRH